MRYALAGLLFVAVLVASRLFLYPRFGVDRQRLSSVIS